MATVSVPGSTNLKPAGILATASAFFTVWIGVSLATISTPGAAAAEKLSSAAITIIFLLSIIMLITFIIRIVTGSLHYL